MFSQVIYLRAAIRNLRPSTYKVFNRLSDDRGDVPGWVLVTVMTAGLVAAIWGLADGQLNAILMRALYSVRMQ